LRVLIIGNSVAGVWCAETLRRLKDKCEITLVSDEPEDFYSRCLLPDLLAQKLSKDQLLLRTPDFYNTRNIKVHRRQKAKAVLPKEKQVLLEGGGKVPYDKLVIATGSSPTMLKVPGSELGGIFGLRKFSDAEGIERYIQKAKKAVVVGGGLVSLKSACALEARGMDTTVVITSQQLLSQTFDKKAADLYLERFKQSSIKILFGRDVARFEGKKSDGKDNMVAAVITDKGENIPADLVIVGKGVYPNVDLVKDSGIKVTKGILTDHYLRTNYPDIYAAGDVAEAPSFFGGDPWAVAIWPAAAEQGKIVGLNLGGEDRPYAGTVPMNSVDFYGLPAISMGLYKAKGEGIEEIVEQDPATNLYRKLVIKNNAIIGAVFMGDVAKAGLVLEAILAKAPVEAVKDDLMKRAAAGSMEGTTLAIMYG
jgi:NAD(P)H-nitrite reductase large subunit